MMNNNTPPKSLHHSRKSPRFSPSPPTTHLPARSKPKSKARPDNSWALSLHVVDQSPLQICYPSTDEEEEKEEDDKNNNSIRRSSRFTSNKYKTPSPKQKALALRDENKNVGSLGVKRRRLLEDKEATGRVGKQAKAGSDEMILRRRSYRLKGGVNGNSHSSPQLLSLPEPGSNKSAKKGFLSEKCLRSRSVLMHKVEKVSAKRNGGDLGVKCLGAPLVKDNLVESIGVVSPVRSGFSGRCLRSRSVKMGKRSGSKRSEKEYALIKLPEDSRSLRGGLRRCDEGSGERSDFEVHEKSAFSSEKRLRSRNVTMQLEKERLESGGSMSEGSSKNLRSRIRRSNQDSGERSDFEMNEKSAFSSERCLRSRSVKMQLERGGTGSRNEKRLMSEEKEYALIELPENSRSLRGSLRRSNRDSVERPNFEIYEKSALSSDKRLRSRNVKMQLEKERLEAGGSAKSASGVKKLKEKCSISPKIESVLDELFGVSEETDKERCDSDELSDKCLTSRKIQSKENAEKSTDRVEGQCGPKGKGIGDNDAVESEKTEKNVVCSFIGEPIPEEEAQRNWQWRYELKSKKKGKKINADEEDEIILNVDCHYAQAKVGNCVLDIGDCVYVKGEGTKKHVGRILEFFKTMEEEDYFRVQWFFRAEDTVLKEAASSHDKKRLFYSTLMNDNPLDCIISKVNIVKIPPTLCVKSKSIQSVAYYYDMEYCVDYSTFRTLVSENSSESQSFLLNSDDDKPITVTPLAALPDFESSKPELALLDLYAGCGGMSTGLCLGAKLSSVNLVTKWAVDFNSFACDSLRLNHPETHVRNETADDFLELLRQWEKLCKLYVSDLDRTLRCEVEEPPESEVNVTQSDEEEPSGEYEVLSLVDICYGDPNEKGKRRLHFKVRWKGYGPDEDTWEPIEGLSNCQERIQEFVVKGFKSKILPLPGDADVICGGPPCQGISGYNRYRNFDSPLADERNRQIVVFMDIVEFLKPKYALMENVADIIRFDKGSLGRYALSRLIRMRYQARLGTIASGCYGLPQFRLRVFIWGAHPHEKLPQFPLPTHDVVVKYWPSLEFERNVVAYDEGQPRSLERAVVLRDSISDLPEVTNDEDREEMGYDKPPETEFQTHIRLAKDETTGPVLYDHRPLKLSEHDYLRVCQIPRRKGANFRDLSGIVVGQDNVARRDPTVDLVMLPTGRPLVPDGVLNFEQGKSRKPYARLWWDETVSTVLTFPHVRAQAILHPEQDRRLTIRECARLQGFPDYYRFSGTIKERYRQIGNAVSIPVTRALGYALGLANRKAIGDEPLMTLPPKFSSQLPSNGEMVVVLGREKDGEC